MVSLRATDFYAPCREVWHGFASQNSLQSPIVRGVTACAMFELFCTAQDWSKRKIPIPLRYRDFYGAGGGT